MKAIVVKLDENHSLLQELSKNGVLMIIDPKVDGEKVSFSVTNLGSLPAEIKATLIKSGHFESEIANAWINLNLARLTAQASSLADQSNTSSSILDAPK
jgi:hypothetical protein